MFGPHNRLKKDHLSQINCKEDGNLILGLFVCSRSEDRKCTLLPNKLVYYIQITFITRNIDLLSLYIFSNLVYCSNCDSIWPAALICYLIVFGLHYYSNALYNPSFESNLEIPVNQNHRINFIFFGQ